MAARKSPPTESVFPEIVSRYESGEGMQLIAHTLGFSYEQIRRTLKKLGVKIRNVSEAVHAFHGSIGSDGLTPSMRYYTKCKKEKLCFTCGSPCEKTKCKECAAKTRNSLNLKKAQGICTLCDQPAAPNRITCHHHIEEARLRYRKLREEAFIAYGGIKCACCGTTHFVFLALDHVNNDGAACRKKNDNGSGLLYKLRRNGWPPGFQVLCHNCNYAKQFGPCPHKSVSESAPCT